MSALCLSPDIVLTEVETHSSYDFILFDASVLIHSQIIKQRVCVCVQASLFQYSVGVTCSSEEEIHINKGNIWGRCILLFLIYTQILTTN